MSDVISGPRSGLRRRSFLLGGAAVGATVLAAGCTSNDSGDDNNETNTKAVGGDNAAKGTQVTIGFSAPQADHGWIGAIAKNAEAQAKQFEDVTFEPVEPTNDVAAQIAAIETLITKKVNVLVVLPNDGKQLTAVARKAMDAGIPVVNLDRIFDSPLAYRTWIGGDNYGMGVSAGHYIGARVKQANRSNPVIAEVAGIDSLPLTQDRSRGFKDALATYGLRVTNRVAAEFTVASGQQVTSNLLQAAPRIDAIWNHDDDQGLGVLAAIRQANRSEFFMVGGAGSLDAMEAIKADNSVLKATVTYSPSMASSAISIARLIGQKKGFSDLVENDVPAHITLASATVTKENVDQYMSTGFRS
ncbi:substrate-binding domain-containing protein [Cryptosporangium aurantiacum]|uniref:Monosaccharide ABC transporter substrate-binding protein, CUT2 family n=1 Tax=Cryptosporangium aurantiacum TaxID=134849 RepID=A0A1M7Q4E9_9ACTN|nr:substrate-binding domain-containing protein [Cryptosporangium aurantiacum]SHN25205.1 monosaccharide ABC transporter substrate-binding protein, CUT2 family [Cryptosporangium aurantiacum]